MKALFLVIIIPSTMITLAIAVYRIHPLGSGRVSFNEVQHDFGERDAGELLTHTFIMTNVGRGRLTVEKVRSTCDCSTVTMSRHSLAPNESATVRVEMRVREAGYATNASVLLATNDRVSPTSLLRLTANTSPAFAIIPSIIDFGTVEYKTAKRLRFNVATRYQEPISVDVEDLLAASPIRAQWQSNQGSRRVLELFLADTAAIGPLTAKIVVIPPIPHEVIGVGKPEPSPLHFSIEGRVRGPFQAEPSAVLLAPGMGKTTMRVTIARIGPPSPHEVKLVDLSESIRPFLEATLNENGDRVLTITSLQRTEEASLRGPLKREGVIRLGAIAEGKEYSIHIPVVRFSPSEECM